MKKVFSLILVTTMILTMLTACGGKSSAPASSDAASDVVSDEVITIVYATPEASGMPTDAMSQWVAKEITERSNGHIVVELHGAGTLGGDTELVSQVMEGTIPLVGLSISALSQYTNLYECTQLPFLLSDYEKEKAALDSDEFAALTAEVEKTLNLKFLGSAENGMRHFATKDRQINGIDDLKGLKLRIMTSNVIQETITRLGANVTTMAYNEVYTGLQNGVIDGEEINITSAGMQKHYEVIKYFTEIGLYPVPAVYVMNGDYWNKLSAEDQELIAQVFAEGHDKAFDEFLPQIEGKCKQLCEDASVTFNTIEDLTPFQEKVLDLYEEYTAKDPKIAAFVEMAQNLA